MGRILTTQIDNEDRKMPVSLRLAMLIYSTRDEPITSEIKIRLFEKSLLENKSVHDVGILNSASYDEYRNPHIYTSYDFYLTEFIKAKIGKILNISFPEFLEHTESEINNMIKLCYKEKDLYAI